MPEDLEGFTCPVPESGSGGSITLAHGEGGRLMRRLIQESVISKVANEYLAPLGDAALLPTDKGRLAFSTDSFVVSPLFFPGGDIGTLAVFGTANDLAVSGARPLWLSLSLIIEEGLALSILERVLASVAQAAKRVGTRIVTGDTKVVPRGAADGLFLNTAGVGDVFFELPGAACLEIGDEILVSGPIGQHGMAVMTSREGLEFDPPPTSDCAPLIDAVVALHQAGIPVRTARDATRGGIAAVLHEWAQASELTLRVNEQELPVTAEVRGACEVLGLDAIYVANEGTMMVAVPSGTADDAVRVLRNVPETARAVRIGEVQARSLASVIVHRAFGPEIPLDEPLGAPLPRIC
ncbi:MAG: hydrogenase expression/formation protein HypE [Pirellulaceae bacterium]